VLREGLTDLQLRCVIESGIRLCGGQHSFDECVGVGVALNAICVCIERGSKQAHCASKIFIEIVSR
jgi:hypothetical protein